MVLAGTRGPIARLVCALATGALAVACAATPRAVSAAGDAYLPDVPLVGEHGDIIGAKELAARSTLTVLVFFSPDCHCLSVHEPRLRALYDADGPRGVQFVMIDSEVSGSPGRDAGEARRRGYPFPILIDRGGRLADALGAEYASHAVVVDSSARVHYRGGIDSDRTHLHDDRVPYLERALDDLLEYREPRRAEGKTLGCALQKW
ncbi:MAG TPA: hypothetical protein VII82_14575 [Polyangiaceae bacterium]